MPRDASTLQSPPGPLTLSDWRQAVRGGASVSQLVQARVALAVDGPADVAWILSPHSAAM
jgi:hypothetical protein